MGTVWSPLFTAAVEIFPLTLTLTLPLIVDVDVNVAVAVHWTSLFFCRCNSKAAIVASAAATVANTLAASACAADVIDVVVPNNVDVEAGTSVVVGTCRINTALMAIHSLDFNGFCCFVFFSAAFVDAVSVPVPLSLSVFMSTSTAVAVALICFGLPLSFTETVAAFFFLFASFLGLPHFLPLNVVTSPAPTSVFVFVAFFLSLLVCFFPPPLSY